MKPLLDCTYIGTVIRRFAVGTLRNISDLLDSVGEAEISCQLERIAADLEERTASDDEVFTNDNGVFEGFEWISEEISREELL